MTKAYISELDNKLRNNFSDITLSQGYAGDLLILLNHYVILEKEVFLEKINRVVLEIYDILTRDSNILKEHNMGLWTGPFGLYYSLYKIDEYVDNNFIANVKKEIQKSCRFLIQKNFFNCYRNNYEYSKDMIFGLAGILLTISQTDLLSLKDKKLLNILFNTVEEILSKYLYTEKKLKVFAPIDGIHSKENNKFINFGYAHGILGLCTSLKKITDKFTNFKSLYKRCLEYCMNYITSIKYEKLNIPYFIEYNALFLTHLKNNNINNNLAWCNGLVGFYIFSENCNDDRLVSESQNELSEFVNKILNNKKFFHYPNVNMCHGYAGLFYAYRKMGVREDRKLQIKNYLYSNFFTLKADVNNFSLLYGRGGSLLTFLSYSFDKPFIGDEIFGF